MAKNTAMDKALAFIIAIVIIVAFGLVYLVSEAFESNGQTALLWKTDSGKTFPNLDWADPPVTPYWDSYASGVYITQGSAYWNYTKVPLFIGNSTYSFSVNDTNGNRAFAQYVIEIPNADRWTIEYVKVNVTKNSDTDLQALAFFSTIQTAGTYDYDVPTNEIYLNNAFGGITDTWDNRNLTVSLAEALDIQDKASGGAKTYLTYRINDVSHDGLTPWAFSISVEIYGTPLEAYDFPQQLSIALISGGTIMLVTGIFATDAVDWGGYRNDIPDRLTGRRKK